MKPELPVGHGESLGDATSLLHLFQDSIDCSHISRVYPFSPIPKKHVDAIRDHEIRWIFANQTVDVEMDSWDSTANSCPWVNSFIFWRPQETRQICCDESPELKFCDIFLPMNPRLPLLSSKSVGFSEDIVQVVGLGFGFWCLFLFENQWAGLWVEAGFSGEIPPCPR